MLREVRIHQASRDQQLICPALELLPKPCAEEVFEHVIVLSQERLHGRLQSRRWIRPKYLSKTQRKPLHRELRKFSQELFKRPPFTRTDISPLVNKLNGLCDSFEVVDNQWENTEQGVEILKDIARKSYEFCTSGGTCTLEETVHNLGLNPSLVCADKRIQQVNKIGRYWGLSVYMAKRSKEYGKLFKNLNLQALQPYQSVKSSISFLPGKRVSCFVHAEIQLVTFYGLNANAATRSPRVLGVSKSACYLCSLFVLIQGHYFITKTHGHLYDLWNVPDLASYEPNQLADYRRVLSDMNKKVKKDLVREKRGGSSRKHPLTSSVALPNGQTLSPLHSAVGTLISNGSSNPGYDLTLPPIRPLVLPTEQQDSSIPLAESPMLNDEPVPVPKHSSSPLLQPKSTRPSSTSRSSTSTPLNGSPTTKSGIGVPSQLPTAQNPKSPNSSAHGPKTSAPSVTFVNKSAHSTKLPQRSSSPSAAPKSTSSSSNDPGSPTLPPRFPKKSPRTRTSSQRSSSPSTVRESSSSSSTNSYPSTPRVVPPLLNIQPTTSHPSSPPDNPISTHSIPTGQSAKPAATASQTRFSNSPVYASVEKSRLLSSTSIASRQLPVLKDISHDSPIRVSAGQISTEIEFQGPGHGKVLVQNIENPGVGAPGTFVDIQALLPNDSLLLERAECDDQLALILQYHRRFLRLDIRWH